MQQNYLNNCSSQPYPQLNPNAVNINIFTPQAYGSNAVSNDSGQNSSNNGYYSMYGQNTMPNLPLYPQNYNAPINYNYANNPIAQQPVSTQPTQYMQPNMLPYQQQPQQNQFNPTNQVNLLNDRQNKTPEINGESTEPEEESSKKTDKKKKDKIITPLTDDYIKNLENYLNSPNKKIRLIGMKELMERFKEDENRKDNKSLVPLLNKALQDTSPTVRFVALTTLQLGYSVGDDTTVKLLVKIANENQDKFGQDAILASEILLKLSAAPGVKVKEGAN